MKRAIFSLMIVLSFSSLNANAEYFKSRITFKVPENDLDLDYMESVMADVKALLVEVVGNEGCIIADPDYKEKISVSGIGGIYKTGLVNAIAQCPVLRSFEGQTTHFTFFTHNVETHSVKVKNQIGQAQSLYTFKGRKFNSILKY